jgi:uncharacterized protein (DUF1015 family)
LTAVCGPRQPEPGILSYEAGADFPAGDLGRFDGAAPDIVAVDDAGIEHRLWLVDPARSRPGGDAATGVARLPLTIADGHHRYQTALRFCAEVGGAGADDVLVLLFEAESGGLSRLATHRLVSIDGDVLDRAAALFEVTAAGVNAVEAVPTEPGEIGVWTRPARPACAAATVGRVGRPSPGSTSARSGQALRQLVGADVDGLTAAGRISYTQDAGAAVAAVDAGVADAAFLLAPTPLTSVIEVAAAGEVMPPKSTFFYPKAATGLVFNPIAP